VLPEFDPHFGGANTFSEPAPQRPAYLFFLIKFLHPSLLIFCFDAEDAAIAPKLTSTILSRT
jgi:hypothetical protein